MSIITKYSVQIMTYAAMAAALSSGCSRSSEADSDKTGENAGKIERLEAVRPAEVTVKRAEVTDFNHEIISNGIIEAKEKAELYFRNPEVIKEIFVRNGQRVTKGTHLARIDVTRLLNTRRQQQTAVEQARLAMKDILIGQGFDPEDTTAIPRDVMSLARTKSGIESSMASLYATDIDLAASTVTAPVSGRIANLRQRINNVALTSEPFCTVVGDNSMEVEFPVMEGEIALMQPGAKVRITSYASNESVTGTVTAINPMVDENGMVKVWASADKTSPGLIDGMNVRVHLHKAVPNQIVVPKTAVLKRNDRQVIFSYDGNGRAIWNYVTTGLENMQEYTIADGLEPGTMVIVSGNINLAHESPVTVMDSIN